tara:strand:+ start:27 stop:1328 length:1302 start_codon:yes stop_codon:yes gene_type:complete
MNDIGGYVVYFIDFKDKFFHFASFVTIIDKSKFSLIKLRFTMNQLSNKINIKGILIAFLILVLPLLLFTHLMVDNVANKLTIYGFSYEHGFPSNQTYVYIILVAIIPIILFSIWYIECNYWWRWVILLAFFPWVDNIIRYKFSNKENIQLLLYSLLISGTLILIVLLLKYLLRKYFKTGLHNSIELKKIKDLNHENIINVLSEKTYVEHKDYLKILVQLEDQIAETIKTKNGFRNDDISKWDYFFITAIIISVCTLYFDYYIFYKFPNTSKIIGFGKEPFGFTDVEAAMYFFAIKIALLIPILIWFFTSPNWWRYALLSPILLTVFQLWEGFQMADKVDETSFYYAAPWLFIVIAIVLYLDKKVSYAKNILESKHEIKRKVEEILNSEEYKNEIVEKSKIELKKIKGGEVISENKEIMELLRLREILLKNINE